MPESQKSVLDALEDFLKKEEAKNGGPMPAVNPGHRKHFIWPHHSLSAQYNVKPQDFTKEERFEYQGEAFQVAIAEPPFGVFGKCEALQAEAKGSDIQQMFINLEREIAPLFERQFAISRILGFSRRYEGSIHDLTPAQLILLLYCPDRDVAHAAMMQIETQTSSGIYTEAFIRIIRDNSHPYRRVAQWCVLDLMEDLPNLCKTEFQMKEALSALEFLMSSAEDDYARAIFKAGDVLGDHVATPEAGKVLLNVALNGEHPYGRRSAIHGLIHLCEWIPEMKQEVINILEKVARTDPLPVLRQYAKSTIQDILSGEPHGPEPILPLDNW